VTASRTAQAVDCLLAVMAASLALVCLIAIGGIAFNVLQGPQSTAWRVALFVLVALLTVFSPAVVVGSILSRRRTQTHTIVRWTSLCILGTAFLGMLAMVAGAA